ncbi:MAG: J domain-containing protein [Actinomycetota bacterium]
MSKKKLSYYAVLGVTADATRDQIQQAYRRRANEYHPDRHAMSPEAVATHANNAMVEANEAFRVLGDPIERQVYDALVLRERNQATAKLRRSSAHGTPKTLGVVMLGVFLLIPLIFTLVDSSPLIKLLWVIAVLVGGGAAASIWIVLKDMNR